jgi:branched-chain amino acid transport system ATP-binding protein
MLKVNNIEVVYLRVIQVLRGVSLEVGDGKIVALLGINGAGKTTTIRAISGMLKTEDGEIIGGSVEFDNKRIDKYNPADIAGMGISQVLEGRRVLEHMTVEQNLMVGAYTRKDQTAVKKDMEMVYEYFPRLKDMRRRTSGYLSGGEQQMMVIGRAFMASPKLMLLDEPSLGLAPLMVKEIYSIIHRINTERNMSMLLVEQNAKAALGIAHHGYVMENGKIVMAGSADKLKDNEDIREFYMGLSTTGSQKSYREIKHYRRKKRWIA